MEKRIYIILFFSGLISGLLIASGAMYHYIGKAERKGFKDGYARGQGTTEVQGATGDAALAAPLAGSGLLPKVKLSRIEIGKHANPASCWLLVNGKVYDVTPYIEAHPGGANEILPNCGTDASAAYASKGVKGVSHSAEAEAMLAGFLLGSLDQDVSSAAISVASGGTATNTPMIPKQSDDDDDGEEEFEDD